RAAGHRSPRTQPAGPARRLRGEPWSCARHASGRSRSLQSPFSAGGVLMCSVDRAVKAMPFGLDVGLQRGKQPAPLAVPRPAVEAIEHGLPWPELFGQIPPRRSGAPPPKHGIDEVPVVVTRFADLVVGCQECLDLRPLLVTQL